MFTQHLKLDALLRRRGHPAATARRSWSQRTWTTAISGVRKRVFTSVMVSVLLRNTTLNAASNLLWICARPCHHQPTTLTDIPVFGEQRGVSLGIRDCSKRPLGASTRWRMLASSAMLVVAAEQTDASVRARGASKT